MTDVRLRNTEDGGEIDVVSGQIQMDGGLFNAVYLSLWGGNENDSGLPVDSNKEWWANKIEENVDRRYRSQTQNRLRSIPATPGNLIKIEDAVSADLEWMTKELKTTLAVTCSMPGFNRILIKIVPTIDGQQMPDILFNEPWSTAS
jgi:phage gp46-like protein